MPQLGSLFAQFQPSSKEIVKSQSPQKIPTLPDLMQHVRFVAQTVQQTQVLQLSPHFYFFLVWLLC